MIYFNKIKLFLLVVWATIMFSQESLASINQYRTNPNDSLYVRRDSSNFGNDGPYVFYRSGDLLSKRISRVNDKYEIRVDSFAYDRRWMYCERDKATPDSFLVKLNYHPLKQKTIHKKADSIFVVSDLEGNVDAFEKLLFAANVVDSAYNWTFGKGHLVVLGDVFDRGLEVTQCLWLIYQLEQVAPKNHVHFILGNHESMNLLGDMTYVRNKYRLTTYALSMEHWDLYGINTVLGRWLRKKNIVEKIGDFIFAHGGFDPYLVEKRFSLKKINRIARKHQDTEKPEDEAKLIMRMRGPMWYRGYFMPMDSMYAKATDSQIDELLRFYEAKAIVVGHTPVKEVKALYDKKIFAVDVKHSRKLKTGETEGLLISGKRFYRLYTDKRRILLAEK